MKNILSKLLYLKLNSITIFVINFLVVIAFITFSEIYNSIIFLALPACLFIIYYIVIKYPEISFAFFLNAGFYKADPRLVFLQNFIDITLLFAIFTIFGILFKMLFNKINIFLPSKEVFIPFSLIAILFGISLTYTSAPIYGTDKVLRLLTITSLSLFLPFFLFKNISSIERFFAVFIFISLMMFFFTILEFSTANQSQTDYLAIGFIAGYSVIVSIFYFFLKSKFEFVKVFYLIFSIVFIIQCVFSGGRGPIIALFTSIIISIFLIFFNIKDFIMYFKINKLFLKFLILIIFTTAVCSYYVIVNDYVFSFFIIRMKLLFSEGGLADSGRIERFLKAIDILTAYPTAITGVGAGGFSFYFSQFDNQRGDFPHNIFLEIGSEIGWIGLIAFIFMMWQSFSTLIYLLKSSLPHKKHLAITLFVLFIYVLLNASKSGDVNDNRSLFTLIGIIYSCKRFKIQTR